jgi:hypothetical protein
VRAGAHAGGVAGCVSTCGSAKYVYPEIAGYYLQWLTWRAQRFGKFTCTRRRRRRGTAVACRLAFGRRPAADAVHLRGADNDWRNRAVFCFDLAMVLRGLAAAARVCWSPTKRS